MKPNKSSRYKLAKSLCRDLYSFGECFLDHILCPVCMTKIHTEHEKEKYTAGHITPESAGGNEWTILCKKCNSKFGERQDKWFSEYLRILKKPEETFIHAKSKSKYITINGVKVSGDIRVSEKDGSIDVITYKDRNPPGKIESIIFGSELVVSFTPELVKHVNEIQIGYITAAYLKWFKAIGYNWIMQSSLDCVRKQILECNYDIDGAKVIEIQSNEILNPDIGVIFESNHAYPCCLMYDRLVIFPAPYISKTPTPKSITFSPENQINLINLSIMSDSYSVNYEGRILIFPDMLKKKTSFPKNMLYVPQDPKKEVQWLTLQQSNIKQP